MSMRRQASEVEGSLPMRVLSSIGNWGPKFTVGNRTRSSQREPMASPATSAPVSSRRASMTRAPCRRRMRALIPGTGTHVPMLWPVANASAAS